MHLNQDTPKLVDLARYTVPVAAVILVVVALSSLLYAAAELFLLLFVGVLLALLLRAVAGPLEAVVPRGIAFTIAALAFFAVVFAMLLFFVPLLVDGLAQLAESLPKAVERIGEVLENHPRAMRAFQDALGGHGAGIATETLARVKGIFSTVIGVVFAGLVVVFTGFYLAAEPDLYRRGMLRLLPIRSRAGAEALLDEIGGMLTRWMFGRS
ncbi:MAG: AI-2E family transporter, partial [Thiohalomonadaceae bacterium]